MALLACPACTAANQDTRTICRVCGQPLKAWARQTASGRISFDIDRTFDFEGHCAIPVLLDGKSAGVNVIVAISPAHSISDEETLGHYRDTRSVVMGALKGRRRERIHSCPKCEGSGSLPNLECCSMCGGGGVVPKMRV